MYYWVYVNTNLGGTNIRCLLAGLIENVPLSFLLQKNQSPVLQSRSRLPVPVSYLDNKEFINSEVSLIVYPNLSASSDVNSLLFIVIYNLCI